MKLLCCKCTENPHRNKNRKAKNIMSHNYDYQISRYASYYWRFKTAKLGKEKGII